MLRAGALALDLQDQRAWLASHPVDLGPKPFALLVALMQSPQRLVTKEELIETVWEGRFVSEAVLTTAMRDLRRAIGDDARQPTYIATAHGRGYRFMLAVTEQAPAEAFVNTAAPASPKPAQSRPHFGFAAAFVAMVLAAAGALWGVTQIAPSASATRARIPASIAVLPFEDLSPARDRAYFADGLSEEILNVLMGVDGLSVASRTSSFAYKDRDDLTTPAIARELGVRNVLEGTVRTDRDRVRVHVRLIEAQSGHTEWTRTYERRLSVQNLLAIQDEIASRVVNEMRGALHDELGPQNTEVRSAAAGTENLQAYELYLRARELFVARSDLARSVALAEQAVAADPRFARGWELFAAASFAKHGRPTVEAQEAVATALRLDPNLSLAHAINGVMSNYEAPYNWNGSTGELERAVTLDPTNTTALLWLAIEMHKLGYLERSQTLLERCVALDSAYDRCREHLMWVLHMRGQTDRAIAEYRTLVNHQAPPDDAILLLAFIERGDEASVQQVLQSLAHEQPMPAPVLAALRDPHADRIAARRALRTWLRASDFNKRKLFPVTLALGAYDMVYTGQGSFFPLWIPEAPEYRQSGAFKNFVREMRIDQYWREHGFPPQCRPVGDADFSCA
ncbi:adenylate cyclase [alpha proteobacterium U9-1i]|nr:adenylate cyclase [alpha proteobacterium U9-1i]